MVAECPERDVSNCFEKFIQNPLPPFRKRGGIVRLFMVSGCPEGT